MMRRFTTALAFLIGAAVLVLAAPAGPASADTSPYSSHVTVDRTVATSGSSVTVTASQLMDSTGTPVTIGGVETMLAPEPFDLSGAASQCVFFFVMTHAPYVCTIDLRGTTPGFYTVALVYEGAGGSFIAGTADFIVTPPLVPTMTQLTASSPLTVQGGTLTATITHADGSITTPTGTVDFTEGTTTFCSGASAFGVSSTSSSSLANCALSTLAPGAHHITATYSGDTVYAGSSGTFDVTVSDPLAITTTALPAGQIGVPYTANLTATGGTAPLHWSLAAGQSLPGGLTVGDDGTLSGTPTGPAWTASVGFVVTDSASSASVSLPLTIKAAIRPTVTGLSPTSGPAAGGTLVTLRGKNLDHAVRVTVGGKAVAFTRAPDGLSLTLHTPRHAPGKVAIVVYGAGSTKSSIAFTFHL